MRGLLLHSTRTTLSLNSHYMLLWINVASFCVSLLTREGDRLRGIFSSSTVSVEEYCVSQLRHIWKLMRSNMRLTDEELSFLVMMCMRRQLQVCSCGRLCLITMYVYTKSLCYVCKSMGLICSHTTDLGELSSKHEWTNYRSHKDCGV